MSGRCGVGVRFGAGVSVAIAAAVGELLAHGVTQGWCSLEGPTTAENLVVIVHVLRDASGIDATANDTIWIVDAPAASGEGVPGDGVVLFAAELTLPLLRIAVQQAATISALRTQVREETDRYEFLVDVADLGDWDLDVRKNRTRRSAKHDALFGYTEKLPSWGYDDFLAHIHPEDRDRVHAAYQRALAGDGDYNVELRTIWADGTLHWLSSRGRFVLDASGVPLRAAGVMADITERKLADERILQLDREDTVGRLAASLAHDFNNQLTVILGTADCIALSPDLSMEQRDDLAQIHGSCERSARMVRELLSLSRNEVRRREPIRLAAFLREGVHTMEHLVGERVHCRVMIPDGEFVVLGEAPQLEQVLLNLVANARDAMPGGGTVTITLEADGASDVVLRVTDTGIGMDSVTLQRCFETFFTTKPRGMGTGLGLASVRRIVTQMDGEIRVTSGVGAGTTFALRFPLHGAADASTRGIGASRTEAATAHGALRILLVDDNAMVRQVVARVLRQNGHSVIDEASGEAAVARDVASGPFDLLITDLVMPTMSGRALADAVLGRHPTTRILLISGYSDDEVARYGLERGTYAFLAKPFTPAELDAAVDALITSTSGAAA